MTEAIRSEKDGQKVGRVRALDGWTWPCTARHGFLGSQRGRKPPPSGSC